jgi:hypothetical protein
MYINDKFEPEDILTGIGVGVVGVYILVYGSLFVMGLFDKLINLYYKYFFKFRLEQCVIRGYILSSKNYNIDNVKNAYSNDYYAVIKYLQSKDLLDIPSQCIALITCVRALRAKSILIHFTDDANKVIIQGDSFSILDKLENNFKRVKLSYKVVLEKDVTNEIKNGDFDELPQSI